mmetsp:Transcript_134777/g.340802  ORF Transcript_134777/g.340802 Transcript_134777/m.340802 type:complete len:106 (+) Transcript_134777:229-546(+)
MRLSPRACTHAMERTDLAGRTATLALQEGLVAEILAKSARCFTRVYAHRSSAFTANTGSRTRRTMSSTTTALRYTTDGGDWALLQLVLLLSAIVFGEERFVSIGE